MKLRFWLDLSSKQCNLTFHVLLMCCGYHFRKTPKTVIHVQCGHHPCQPSLTVVWHMVLIVHGEKRKSIFHFPAGLVYLVDCQPAKPLCSNNLTDSLLFPVGEGVLLIDAFAGICGLITCAEAGLRERAVSLNGAYRLHSHDLLQYVYCSLAPLTNPLDLYQRHRPSPIHSFF